jgi:hypothetical protein
MTQDAENGTVYIAELALRAVCSDAECLEPYRRVDHAVRPGGSGLRPQRLGHP